MKTSTKLLIVSALLAAVVAPAAQARTAAELLREGLYVEEVEGDLDKAVGIYQQVVADASAPKNLVAQALYRQGSIYLKQKREQDAKAVFTKLVDGYSDQTEIVEKVRPILEELGNSDPAMLMPPETIAYIEIGSPGRQVETILNMLKGTPVEEALASLKQESGWEGGGPAAMIRGLLNPSMMAELKKIRGIGLGITELSEDNPPALIVLFPGKSDALKGLLQMALTGLGRAGDPVEGMKVVTFGDENDGSVAYDDTVVIASTRPEMLKQAIVRYKGKARQSSLASANRSFTSISKQARQQNAVTLWLNVDETYGQFMKMVPPDQIPEHIQIANGFVDFQNVDDLIASFSLRETGAALDANVNFKDGAKSMFYNLIRTPNLSRDALKVVPAQAVALVSLTLGGADSAQAQALSAKIKEKTGMDLGPQIFGNVEQITLFAAPSKNVVAAKDSPIPAAVQALGLAITSRNPSQVHQLLTTLLQTANLLSQDAPAIPASGRFDLTLGNGMKLFGNTAQANRTTVLAINSQVIDAAATAGGQNASVVSAGVLQDGLATLPPATSKLALINVAGAIQLASQTAKFPSEEVAAQVRQSLDELAKATEKTTVRLHTSEQDNSLSIRLSINDLPPIQQIIGPIATLAKIMEGAQSPSQAEWDRPTKAVCIFQASRPPEIDGKADDAWSNVESNPIANVAYSPASDDKDFSAGFKTLYDHQALYVLVDVADDKLVNDSDDFWLDDTVEVFLDADNSKSNGYEDGDYVFYFSWDASTPILGETKHDRTEGVKYAFAKTDGGYRVEIKLPWSTLGTTPGAGGQIGLDVHVNDDDDGGDRDTKLMWCTTDDNAWQNPSALGTGNLACLVAWWKLDEKEGSEAADSSSNGRDAQVHGDPAWLPTGGKIGGALQLDGDGDYVDTGYDTDLATWTAAVWVKSPAAPTGDNQSGPVHREKNLQINWNHVDDEFRGAAGVCIGGTWYGASFGDLQGDTWYHLTATFDGRTLRAYKNGGLVMANGGASGVPSSETETLKLGRHAAYDAFFAGTIDDVRLYNYSLSEAEVTELSQGR
ncbi:MAG: hypothetical protein KBE65_00205 [Phycisphaerae bacterium]|nr:hypothetical protein [Phycisphaerae bacterium]